MLNACCEICAVGESVFERPVLFIVHMREVAGLIYKCFSLQLTRRAERSDVNKGQMIRQPCGKEFEQLHTYGGSLQFLLSASWL